MPEPRLPRLTLLAVFILLASCSRVTAGTYEGDCDYRGVKEAKARSAIRIVVQPKAANVEIELQGDPAIKCLLPSKPKDDVLELEMRSCKASYTPTKDGLPLSEKEVTVSGTLSMRENAITTGTLKLIAYGYPGKLGISEGNFEESVRLENIPRKK